MAAVATQALHHRQPSLSSDRAESVAAGVRRGSTEPRLAEPPKVPAMRSIVGMAAEGMRDHMRTELPLAALMMAAQRQRPAEGLICHSDRGSQYASEAYGKRNGPVLLPITHKSSQLRFRLPHRYSRRGIECDSCPRTRSL